MSKVSIVQIRGPLYRNPFEDFDTYRAIVERVRLACELEPSVVLLDLDSPGGVFSGCVEASLEIRHLAEAAGKSLVCQIDGEGCSAAFVLACAADHIVAQPTALIGSLGVLEYLRNVSEHERSLGVHTELVSSGARKADGSPLIPLTAEALQERKNLIEEMAGVLFDHVSTRRKIPVNALRALEGRCLIARRAQEIGLIDSVIGDEECAQVVQQARHARLIDGVIGTATFARRHAEHRAESERRESQRLERQRQAELAKQKAEQRAEALKREAAQVAEAKRYAEVSAWAGPIIAAAMNEPDPEKRDQIFAQLFPT